MGLDNYFQPRKEISTSEIDDTYFRGNIYFGFLKELCGVTIYKEWVSPHEVKQICDALYDALISKPGTDDNDLIKISEHSREELSRLLGQFMKYVSLGYGLYGCY